MDTVTTRDVVNIDLYFVDGDNRTITLKNPADTITQEQVLELQTLIRTNNLLIGDKGGAAFGRINTVTKVTTTTTDFDLTTT